MMGNNYEATFCWYICIIAAVKPPFVIRVIHMNNYWFCNIHASCLNLQNVDFVLFIIQFNQLSAENISSFLLCTIFTSTNALFIIHVGWKLKINATTLIRLHCFSKRHHSFLIRVFSLISFSAVIDVWDYQWVPSFIKGQMQYFFNPA